MSMKTLSDVQERLRPRRTWISAFELGQLCSYESWLGILLRAIEVSLWMPEHSDVVVYHR